MARQYLYLNGQQIPLNGQDFWVGTHQQFESANPPIPKGTLLYFTDGEVTERKWERIARNNFDATESTVALGTGKFSDYNEICFLIYANDYVRGSFLIPVEEFVNKSLLYKVPIGGADREVKITYVDDTHYKCSCTSWSITMFVNAR